MDKLNFIQLHKEKLDLIFHNIDVLSNMKENDTTVPPKFFKEATDDVFADYKAKMAILKKNTAFCVKELKKDFRLLRKAQKLQYTLLRQQQKKETVVYVLPKSAHS